MKQLLFTFEGRINRKPFWVGVFVLFLFSLAGFLIYIGVAGFDTVMDAPEGSRSLAIVSFMVSLVLFGPWLAILIKRLHDRGKSGWWSTVFIVPEYFYQFVDAIGLTGGTGLYNMFDYAAGGLYLLVTIWLIVELGILKGMASDNAYGPDPLGMSE